MYNYGYYQYIYIRLSEQASNKKIITSFRIFRSVFIIDDHVRIDKKQSTITSINKQIKKFNTLVSKKNKSYINLTENNIIYQFASLHNSIKHDLCYYLDYGEKDYKLSRISCGDNLSLSLYDYLKQNDKNINDIPNDKEIIKEMLLNELHSNYSFICSIRDHLLTQIVESFIDIQELLADLNITQDMQKTQPVDFNTYRDINSDSDNSFDSDYESDDY